MIKSLIALAATAAFIASISASHAQTAAATSEECLKSAVEIAQTAEAKKLTDDQAKQAEGLLDKMEQQCDAKQFAEAASTGKELSDMLAKIQ